MSDILPRIAITQGDPAGIGPEIIVRAWPTDTFQTSCRPFVIGDPEILRRTASMLDQKMEIVEIDSPEDADLTSRHCIACLPINTDLTSDFEPGRISAACGEAAYQATVDAAKLALEGRIDAMVTAPLHKKALRMAGHDYPGHTELLAELCDVDDFAMMLYLAHDETIRSPAGLAVVHVTLHMAMTEVFEAITKESVLAKAHLADRFMALMKGERPRIGVTALNPHGGESGLFGNEELEIIEPAVRQGCEEGLDLVGPRPSDTLLIDARDGRFDAVVAMYHDQGHIALKLLGMHRAVNITLGLPIVRTSVAHGTAFDRAWKGDANEGSLIEAVRVASVLAGRRAASS